MPEVRFSTCREWVVAPGQHVRIELDLFDGSQRPEIFEAVNSGSSLEWLDNRTFLYKCPVKPAYVNGSRGGFMLRAGNAFARFSVVIHPDYVRSAEQQVRDRVLGGGGDDPRVAELQARIDAARRALG